MILTLIIVIIITIIIALTLLLFTFLFDSEYIKIYKLGKIVNSECHTKTKFSYRTKIMGTYYYIFVDNLKAYTISEYGNVCGYRNIN